jgi:HSP20 family molecular chaperone IbpA
MTNFDPYSHFKNIQNSIPDFEHPNFDHFNNIKEMMKQYKQVLNDDFWKEMSNPHSNMAKQKKGLKHIPIEIWETDKIYQVLAFIPGIKNQKQVEINFTGDNVLVLSVKKPSRNSYTYGTLVYSELENQNMHRNIKLPIPVITDSYTMSYENGILKVILKKNTINLDDVFFE